MDKKYELTDSMDYNGVKLFRIRALRDIKGMVKAGDLGGWVESEANLSHEGDCWIFEEAKVYGKAEILHNARVCNRSEVMGNANVEDCAVVGWEAKVYGSATLKGHSVVCGCAEVFGGAVLLDEVKVCGTAKVSGTAVLNSFATISGDAIVNSSDDYHCFRNTWSSRRWFTYTKSNKKWLVGCFYGTGDELIARAYSESKPKGKCYEAAVKYVAAIEAVKEEYGV